MKQIVLSSKSRIQHNEEEIRRLALKLHEFLNMDYPIITNARTDYRDGEIAPDVSDAFLPQGLL